MSIHLNLIATDVASIKKEINLNFMVYCTYQPILCSYVRAVASICIGLVKDSSRPKIQLYGRCTHLIDEEIIYDIPIDRLRSYRSSSS